MGHKKRNFAPRTKPSPASVSPAGGVTADGEVEPCINTDNPNQLLKIEPPCVESAVVSPYSAIKLECERALTAIRRGNHTKALRLMKESCSRHESSALIHRVQGTVCVKVAAIIDDPNAKQRHLKNAIESARRAVELSPNSIEFAHFYANLMYEAANEVKEYEEVVQECERALAIEIPVDPGKESLQEESQQKLTTAESRIGHVQNELKQLIQKSNIASISNWMKNLGNGEDKFRLIPIRRATEDPMEVRLVQARRPNEIKKATKTPEERRKEIEVRVAAARLLQQKSEVPQLQNEGDRADRALDLSSGSGQRAGERRKNGNLRKTGSSTERKDWVRAYWNSMSMDQKKDLLSVKICDLKAHFGSAKDILANEVLSEAVTYAEANKMWKFWVCCRCNEKFSDTESQINHVVHEHMTNLLPKMQSILPQNVETEWADMLLNSSWKPLDISAAVKMLGNQSKDQDSDLVEDFYSGDHTEDCDDCFKDACDSTPQKENRDDQDLCNGYTMESNDHDKSADIECRECDGNQGPLTYSLSDSWPISDDSECAKLLERVRASFEVLIKHKYLATSHFNKVIQFTMDELQGLASGSQLLNHGVDQTPICICFLGASQLRKILKFLQDLSHSCGIGRYPDKSSPVDDSNNTQEIEIKEKIVLSGDASCLILDDGLLPSECSSDTRRDDPVDDTIVATSGLSANENDILLDADALLSWIFSGPTSTEQLTLWMHKKEEKTQQGVEIFQTLEKEFFQLQSLCERKGEYLSYEEAVQAVEDLRLEEGKKRETGMDNLHRSYESVLRKRREELVESENDVTLINNRFELDAISNILKEAETLNTNQFGYEETYAGMNSQLCDLESGEEGDWRGKDSLHQLDTCIEVAIQRQKEQLSVELSKIDARIMRNVTGMQQLELKLDPVAAYDYRLILLPLVKSYLRAHLEDLAERDATEKSDAAREAFLAELALDSKKGAKGGSDNFRHSQEKAKDKKKSKEYRKTKDSKATGSNEQHMLRHGTGELVSSCTVASDGDHPEPEIVVSANADDLRQQEEEFRRKIELEEEERKLEETLEYQRRIENEAKLKHLAELHKKSTRTLPERETEELNDNYLEIGVHERKVNEHMQPCIREQPVQRNGFSNTFEVMTMNSADTMMPIKTSTAHSTQKISKHLANVKQGPNGAISVDGPLPSDRRMGRKGKRQKSATKLLDGYYQGVPAEKENVEVARLQVESCTKDLVKSQDPLHKGSASPSGDHGTKTLRQLQAEEDDEERFQADLKQAVRQSLDTYKTRQKFPLLPNSRMPNNISIESDDHDISLNEVTIESVSRDDIIGTGLKNEVGEYNCFLNVIIQSLWHLRRFRDGFLRRSRSEHVHVGEPCVVCALYDIFTALSIASTDTRREAVAPTSLRIALSNLYPDSNFFQEAQMNDASEVLGVIFDCLHCSFTPGSGVSDTESLESNNLGSWDCSNNACIAHSLFGMDIFERMNCYSCGLESRHFKYTTFFHNINASALRTMKVMCAESSFDELLNVVEMNHQLACDPEAGGCGKLNYIHHIISTPPHVFTTVLGWQNTCESAEDISATLMALNTEIDISVLYRGLDPKNTHSLISVVCYYGQHYHCFAYSHDHEQWIMYDDKTVKVVGGWADVVTMCERGHLQPQVLFFEAVN